MILLLSMHFAMNLSLLCGTQAPSPAPTSSPFQAIQDSARQSEMAQNQAVQKLREKLQIDLRAGNQKAIQADQEALHQERIKRHDSHRHFDSLSREKERALIQERHAHRDSGAVRNR